MGKQHAFKDPVLSGSQSPPQAGEATAASPQVASTGHERFVVALEAALGAELSLLVVRQHFTTLAFKQMLPVAAALMAVRANRTAAEAAGHQPASRRRGMAR